MVDFALKWQSKTFSSTNLKDQLRFQGESWNAALYRAAQMQRIVLLALCRSGAARIWILWMDGGGGGAATEQTTYAHDGSQKSGALTTWLVLCLFQNFQCYFVTSQWILFLCICYLVSNVELSLTLLNFNLFGRIPTGSKLSRKGL